MPFLTGLLILCVLGAFAWFFDKIAGDWRW